MRLSALRPYVAGIQALLLLFLQLAEGTGVHHCPEHDAGVGAVMSEMANHMGHHPGSGPERHGCHCVGTCCKATLPPFAAAPIASVLALDPAPVPESAVVTSLRGTVRLLPFAIGPPAIA